MSIFADCPSFSWRNKFEADELSEPAECTSCCDEFIPADHVLSAVPAQERPAPKTESFCLLFAVSGATMGIGVLVSLVFSMLLGVGIMLIATLLFCTAMILEKLGKR